MDVVALTASAVTASLISGHDHGGDGSGPLWVATFGMVILAVLVMRRTYRFRVSGSMLDEISSVILATTIATVTVIALRAVFSTESNGAIHTFWWAAVAALNLIVLRAGSYLARRRTFLAGNGYNTLIVGAGAVGRQVARRFLERPELGLRPVGFLDKEPRHEEAGQLELPVLGASWDLEQHAVAHCIDHVVIAFSTAPHHVLVDIVRRSHRLGLHVLMVPRLFEEVCAGNDTEFAGGIPLQRIERAAAGWPLRLKYATDRVVAGLALAVTGPTLLLVALAVRCSSPGPVLFRQRRVGLDGREFDMLKFRTMVGSADVHGEADAGWVSGIVGRSEQANRGEPIDRRTAIGKVLRKWSVDEIPQLINVLRGEMSLVGPRPERAAVVSMFNESVYRYSDRHRMKCGITGWAQVHGLRGETSLADRIEWDNHYIQNWSLWLDLKILLLTIPAMMRGSADGPRV